MEIEVDLEVFKALTALLRHEKDGYSDVIRGLLKLDSIVEPATAMVPSLTAGFSENLTRAMHPEGGFISRGLWLPNGTQLRARYKQQEYNAQISDNAWWDSDGKEQTSPSSAAATITKNNVNGLRFWEAQLPGATDWRRLDMLN